MQYVKHKKELIIRLHVYKNNTRGRREEIEYMHSRLKSPFYGLDHFDPLTML